MVGHACNPSYVEGKGRRIMVWGLPWAKTQDPTWKLTKPKKGISKRMAQVLEHLPSKHKVLNSKPSTTITIIKSYVNVVIFSWNSEDKY
jgi:hypothetical protein